MSVLLVSWIVILSSMKVVESITPARTYQVQPRWWGWWLAINTAALCLSLLSSTLYTVTVTGSGTIGLVSFYLIYSFANYWVHRAKHAWLWRVHELHHAPQHMATELCLWRHPVETAINLAVVMILGYLWQIPAEIIMSALLIEGGLESWHHSNIRTPRQLRWLCWIFQTPEMHLVHHQTGYHASNYSPLSVWDWLFSTVRIPTDWNFRGSVGLSTWGNWRYLIWWG